MKKYTVYRNAIEGENQIGFLVEYRGLDINKEPILYTIYDWWWAPIDNKIELGKRRDDYSVSNYRTRNYIKTDIEFDTKEEFLDWITEKYFIEML